MTAGDVHAIVEHQVDSRAHATAFIAEHRQRFPEVPPGYRPSGKMAPGALGKLIKAGLGALPMLLAVGSGFIGFFALVLAFAGPGLILRNLGPWASGVVAFGAFGYVENAIERAAADGACRSLRVARTVAVALAMLGCATLAALYSSVQRFWPSAGTTVPMFRLSWSFGIGAAMGIGIAAWLASMVDLSKAARYCESCEQSMVRLPLPAIDLETFTALKTVLVGGDPVSLAPTHSPMRVDVELHHCPTCATGYVEGRVTLRLSYQAAERRVSYPVSWRCLSTQVDAKIVSWLRDEASPRVRF
jgi:hypothetical protein